MSKINEGGFAFPTPTLFSPTGQFLGGGSDGMTLRDWFAGQALSGLVPNDHGGFKDWSWYANASYHLADAMLAAREVGTYNAREL